MFFLKGMKELQFRELIQASCLYLDLRLLHIWEFLWIPNSRKLGNLSINAKIEINK